MSRQRMPSHGGYRSGGHSSDFQRLLQRPHRSAGPWSVAINRADRPPPHPYNSPEYIFGIKGKGTRRLRLKLLRTALRLPWLDILSMAFGPYKNPVTPPNYELVCSTGPMNWGPRPGGSSTSGYWCAIPMQAWGPLATQWTALSYVGLFGPGPGDPTTRGTTTRHWRRKSAGSYPVSYQPTAMWPGNPDFPDPLPDPETFQPPPRPIPWIALPAFGPQTHPEAPGGEGSSAGNHHGGEAPQPEPEPAPSFEISPHNGGHPTTPTDDYHQAPPQGGVKERKVKFQIGGVAARIVGMLTEGLDWIAVFHSALPKECQAKPTRMKGGKWAPSSPQAKMAAIYDHFECLDLAKVLANAGYNMVEDRAFGHLGRLSGQAAHQGFALGLNNRAVGYQFGDWDTAPVDFLNQLHLPRKSREKRLPRDKSKCKC